MADPIYNRNPYKITYYDLHGQKKTVRRVPPAKLHDALPEDRVEILNKHNDNFDVGDTVKVQSINPRNANVLKLENSDGNTIYAPYFDLKLNKKLSRQGQTEAFDLEVNNEYLLWP